MARTSDTIFDLLMDGKDNDAVLSLILTSSSKASFYQSLFALYADTASNFELTYDDFVEEMEALLDSKQVMTDSWWRATCLAYQFGDSLVVDESGNVGYETVDEDNYLVERAAVVSDSVGTIKLKVAKLDTDGITPVPLSTSEKTAFDAYINDVQPAGIAVEAISLAGDEVQVGIEVVIDEQVLNVDDGTLLSDGETKPVEDAIYDYFATFQEQEGSFGGTFYSAKLNEKILAADGVVSCIVSELNKQAANESVFTDILAESGRKFLTYSGYVQLADGWDLSANISYE